MDYSLIIFKVNWSFLLEGENVTRSGLTRRLQHCYEGKDGFYYHIGLIDYLQTYNSSKIMEKLAKKLINMNFLLDTSS